MHISNKMAATASPMRVALLGGRGFIGRAVARALLSAPESFEVRLVTRGSAKDTRPAVPGAETCIADVGTSAGMLSALDGCSGVVNLIGLLHETGITQTFEAAHTGIARTLADATAGGDVRVVHLSAIGANHASGSAYARTKAAAEVALAGAEPVVLRPSIVYGPEDAFFNRFATMLRFSPFLPLIGGGTTRYQPVHVDDVAAAVVRSLRSGSADAKQTAAGVYQLGGRDVRTFRELMQMVARVSGRTRPLVSIPYPVAALQGSLFEAVHNIVPSVPPMLTRDQVELLKSDNVVDEGAAGFKELGIEPRGCADEDIAYISGT